MEWMVLLMFAQFRGSSAFTESTCSVTMSTVGRNSGVLIAGEDGRGISSGASGGLTVNTGFAASCGSSTLKQTRSGALPSVVNFKEGSSCNLSFDSKIGVDVACARIRLASGVLVVQEGMCASDSWAVLCFLIGVAALTISLNVSVAFSSSSVVCSKHALSSSSIDSSKSAAGQDASSRVISPMSTNRRRNGLGCGYGEGFEILATKMDMLLLLKGLLLLAFSLLATISRRSGVEGVSKLTVELTKGSKRLMRLGLGPFVVISWS